MLLFSVLLCFIVQAKKQKDFEFELKEGKSIDVPFKLEKEYIVLYVRPQNEKDDLGEIQFKSNSDTTTILDFYETAIFNTKDVNLKCIIEPCIGRITILSLDPIDITTTITTLTLTQKQPIQLVSLQLTKQYNRMIGEFKVLDDESDQLKIEVFDNNAVIYGDKIQFTVGIHENKCDQCKLLAVLSGDLEIKEEAQFTGQLFLYKDTQQIQLDQDIQDYLFEREENIYKLQLPQQFNLLQLAFIGNKLPLLKIYNKDQEYLNTKESLELQGQSYHIYLRKEDIDNNEIYIKLKQGGQLKYLLNIKILDEPIFYYNQFIISPIKENSKHTYSFKTSYNDQEIGIDIQYINKGNNQLKIGECNRNCELLNEDNHNFRFKQDEQNPSVYLTPECSSKDDQGFCRFQLELSSQINNLYLLSTTNEKHLQIIKVNQQYTNYLEQSQQQHFIVKYQKQDDDVELIFTVNTHNIVYMISKNNKCFPVRIECAKHYGGLDHLIILRGKQLQHSQFYVTLTARETSFFQFIAKVTKKSDIDIKIMKEDETYRGVIKLENGESKINYFRIMVNLQKYDESIEQIIDEQPSFEFVIHSSRMQIALTLNVGDQLPSLQNYQLMTFNNYLSIQPEDSNYIKQGNYTIGIQNLFDTFKDKEILYTFTYTTSRTVKTLHIGQQFIDQVRGQKIKYFSFYYSHNTTIFYITLSGKKSEKLILSVQNEFINKSQNIYKKNDHSSTLKLDQLQLQKLCLNGLNNNDNDEDDDNKSTICQAYILVENTVNENILFNINLWNPTAAIELKDGQQYSFNLEYLDTETFLYYKVITDNTDVQININSHSGYTRYSIELLNSNGSISLFSQEEYKTQHSKSIYSSAFEFCGSDCVIKIMLQGKQIDYNDVKRDLEFNDNVYITISQQYMDIQNGIPIQIQVTDTKPRKFLFHDIQNISPQSRFKLVLHEIYGKGQICLSFSDEDQLNELTCDYETTSNVIELTQIQINEQLNNLSLKQNPFIIIKIYSLVSSSKFQLQLQITDNINDHKLTLGIPTRIKLDIQEQQIYQYFNIQNNDELYFKFIKIQGTGQIEISRCLNETKKECKEEIIIDEQLLAGQTFNQHIIKKNDQQKYCELCTYLIKIKTIGINLDMLIVITSQQNFVQLPQNLAFTDYLEGINDYNLYHFSYDTDHQIEIQLNQYNGNTQMWIGYNAQFNESQYQYGPYNIKKQQTLMNTTQNISYYQAILPPKEHIDLQNLSININKSNTLNTYYNDDDIYIIVKNNNDQQQSNYSIQVTQSTTGNGQLLQDGIITNAYLSKQTPYITLYHQYKYNKQPHLFIKVIPYGNLNIIQYQDYFKVEVSNETQPINYTILIAHSIYNNQINYILPIMEGILTIKIHSLLEIQDNQNNNIQYIFNPQGDIVPIPNIKPLIYQFSHNYLNRIDLQISIVGKELFMINHDSKQIDQIYDGIPKFYESFIQQDSKLILQIYNCLGDLNISLTQNYDNLMRNNYSIQKSTLQGQLNDIIIPVQAGPIYYQFQSDKSVYKFTTKIFNQNDITPYGKLLLGGDGQINYSFETYDPDIITIKFKPIKCIGCDLNQEINSLINYQINWGSNIEYSHIIGLCQYNQYLNINQKQEQHYGQLDIGNYHLNETQPIIFNITVDKQSLHNQLYISIRAQILLFDNKIINDYELYYHITEISLPKNAIFMYKHMFIEFLLSLGILLLFILTMLCCLCSFYRKSRQLKLQNLNLQLEKKMEEIKTQVKYDQFQEDVENNDQS